jgi:hypothetical protein
VLAISQITPPVAPVAPISTASDDLIREVLEPLAPVPHRMPWRTAAASLPHPVRAEWAQLATQYEDAGLHDQAAERLALVNVATARLSPEDAEAIVAHIDALPADIDPPADWPPLVARSASPEDLRR